MEVAQQKEQPVVDIIRRTFQQNEAIIARSMESFLDVGNALVRIRDDKQYLGPYKTFEEYCQRRWGFSRPRAYQYIESAGVVGDLSTIVDIAPNSSGKTPIPAPSNEAQARVIAEASDDAQVRKRIWREAVVIAPKDADGNPNITASVVKKAANKIVPPKPKKPAKAKAPKPVTPGEYDDGVIDDLIGKLSRCIEARAEALGQLQTATHRSMRNSLEAFQKTWNGWQRETRK
jgi:hypothetical protein